MRKLALILLVALVVNIGWSASAMATPVTWGPQTWGTNPFDTNSSSAIRRVEEAVQPMNVPAEVKRLWIEAVRGNQQGTPYSIRPGECFDEMQTRTGLERRGVCVPRGVTLVPSAVAWTVKHAGRDYTLVMPDICHNFAWSSRPSAWEVPAEEECTTVEVAVREGDVLAPAVLTSGTLPPSRCWAFKQGTNWGAWPSGCEQCIDWAPALARVPEADREVQMPGRVRIARSGTVWVRIPRQMEGEHYHLALYLVRNGLCSWAVIHHNAWIEHAFTISEGDWRWRPPS